MYPKLKLLIFISFFFCLKLTAQTAVITGKISDESNNQVLAGATVTLGGTKKSVTTQSDGTYLFQNLTAGKYSLLVSYVGYDSKNVADVEVITGEITTINITLVPAKNSKLAEVTV